MDVKELLSYTKNRLDFLQSQNQDNLPQIAGAPEENQDMVNPFNQDQDYSQPPPGGAFED